MKLEIEVAGREEAAASLLEEVARTGRVSASAETSRPV